MISLNISIILRSLETITRPIYVGTFNYFVCFPHPMYLYVECTLKLLIASKEEKKLEAFIFLQWKFLFPVFIFHFICKTSLMISKLYLKNPNLLMLIS